MLKAVSMDSTSPGHTTRANYCTEDEKCSPQELDNRSDANAQTPFVSPFPSRDSLSYKLHLASRGRLSIPDIFY